MDQLFGANIDKFGNTVTLATIPFAYGWSASSSSTVNAPDTEIYFDDSSGLGSLGNPIHWNYAGQEAFIYGWDATINGTAIYGANKCNIYVDSIQNMLFTSSSADFQLPTSFQDTTSFYGISTFNASSTSISGAANHNVTQSRTVIAATAGKNLTYQAGGCVSAGTNLAGGSIILKSGIATGNGASQIDLYTVRGSQGSGTTDRTPALKATLSGLDLGVTAGASTTLAKLTGTLFYSTTTVGSNGTPTETDLWTMSIPANALFTNGDSISFYMVGTTANNINNKRLRLYFGLTTIFDTTATAEQNSKWELRGNVIRTGAATQKCYASLIAGSKWGGTTVQYVVGGETLSSAVTFRITGLGVAASDIVFEMGKVIYEPAP